MTLVLSSTIFIQSLLAPGPIQQHAAKMTLYDALIGDWEADVIDYLPDGTKLTGKGEWHFAWVLEGRAIQDVWISPKRSERNAKQASANRYGTSIRVYDPNADVWHVTWINPVSGAFNTLDGRKEGDAIVQEGTDGGRKIRWIFDNITPRSFHWKGEVSEDGGNTWRLAAEFFGRRAPKAK